MTQGERLAERIDSLALEDMENETVRLMEEFEGVPITYRRKGRFQNAVLLVWGGVLAACLWMKEKNDEQVQKKRREESLTAAYPDLVSGFLVLTGAGYSIRQAWKKTVQDRKTVGDASVFRGLPGNAGHVEPDGDGDAGGFCIRPVWKTLRTPVLHEIFRYSGGLSAHRWKQPQKPSGAGNGRSL